MTEEEGLGGEALGRLVVATSAHSAAAILVEPGVARHNTSHDTGRSKHGRTRYTIANDREMEAERKENICIGNTWA